MADDLVLEMRDIRKEFPGVVANDERLVRRAPRRGARAARRERRRQVDAHEHPLRPLPARRGRDPAQREARLVLVGARGDRGRDRDGAPALHAHPGDDRRREHRPRRRAATRGSLLDEKAGGASGCASSPRQFGLAVDPDALVERHHASASSSASRSSRRSTANADLLILDEPTAVLTPQEAQELFEILRSLQARGDVDHLHQPQAQRGARDRRPHHGPAARQDDRDGAA